MECSIFCRLVEIHFKWCVYFIVVNSHWIYVNHKFSLHKCAETASTAIYLSIDIQLLDFTHRIYIYTMKLTEMDDQQCEAFVILFILKRAVNWHCHTVSGASEFTTFILLSWARRFSFFLLFIHSFFLFTNIGVFIIIFLFFCYCVVDFNRFLHGLPKNSNTTMPCLHNEWMYCCWANVIKFIFAWDSWDYSIAVYM